jgi:hypothetical protein
LSQKLRRLVNVWYWSPPTVESWWSQRGCGSWWIPYMLGLWTCLWLLLLLNPFLSFGFCFICSLGLGFLFFPYAHQIYKISTTLLSGHISILFRLTWITGMEKFFILINSSLLLMFICWRMSGVCDWQLVPWDCGGGKSCGTFHSGQILNLLLCLWISQLCILVDPLHSQLVVSDNDVFTILCILCRHSYMFSLAYLTDSHCVLWYVSEKGTTWWW